MICAREKRIVKVAASLPRPGRTLQRPRSLLGRGLAVGGRHALGPPGDTEQRAEREREQTNASQNMN
jgi:hypothetical protein